MSVKFQIYFITRTENRDKYIAFVIILSYIILRLVNSSLGFFQYELYLFLELQHSFKFELLLIGITT